MRGVCKMHKKAWSALFTVFIVLTVLWLPGAAFAADYDDFDAEVLYNGRQLRFDNAPIVVDGTALVEARTLAKAFGASVKWSSNTQSVKLTTDKIALVLEADWDIMTKTSLSGNDEDLEKIALAVAPRIIDDVAYVPVRDVVKAFGAKVEWDSDTGNILIAAGGYRYNNTPAASPLADFRSGSGHTFYFQNQSDWELPGYGSGYCWTVSYAMLISDVTGRAVTPVDVAAVNEKKSGDGSYCYHWDIVKAFGVDFVPALDENSAYYGGRDSNSGGTKIKNANKDESVAIEALKEALNLHPEGVMVRYASYPHTMVAVGYDGNEIYFNEPMQISRKYMDSSSKENVPFEETCVGQRGISIAEITFIQALR